MIDHIIECYIKETSKHASINGRISISHIVSLTHRPLVVEETDDEITSS